MPILANRSENLDLSLSVPHHYNNNGYIMNDQTFHTPSFGDEEFVDIPPLHMQQQQMTGMQHHQQHLHQYAQHHHGPQVRPSYMGMMNPAQDGLLTDGQPSYQQPLYLQPQEHQIHNTYGSQQPPGNYLIQQQPGGQRLLVMQPPQQPGYGRSPPQPSPATPAGINDTHTTTSEDSDDSTPHHTPMVGVGGAVKRPSPEPVGNEIGHQLPKQLAKKPKVQKKKKKRDPNEPQKPVSAYALFFRDTQAAIKGQNPNASFGEVSKIVASMWDGLDSEHKSVYKQKTEAAKKEYLKALAAYRASLVSKGGSEAEGGMYGTGGGNGGGGPYGGFYPNAGTGAGQGYGGGQSPPAPSRSPLVSPPHHLSMIGMHHPQMPMGPPHHHHQQPYMHHTHQPPLNSPHQSPQHHMPPGPMGPQAQHMGPQGPPMGTQVQQIGSQNQQMPQSGQSPQQQQQQQQMNHQQMTQQNNQQQMNQQQINQQASQMGQQQPTQMVQSPQQVGQQPQQMVQQGQMNAQNQMCPQSQGLVQNHQNQQMRSPQGQNVNQMSMANHQSPPHNGQQNQHQGMNPHHQQNGSQGQQSNGTPEGGNGSIGQGRATACIRHGCTNPAIANSEWEDEYCSNECVVSHCRDVFSSWVASNNNQSQNFSAVK